MGESIFEEAVFWKPLYRASAIMFALSLMLLPVSRTMSMIVLFSIICLWSRIIPMVFPPAREIDVIDFFVLIIAVNIGGLVGALFGAFNMLFSRFFSQSENIHYTLKDTLAYFLGAFLLPVVYGISGSLLTAIFFFVAFRYAVRMAVTFLFDRECLGEEIGSILVGVPLAALFNTFLVKFFGPVTTRLIEGGIGFSFEIFALAAALLGIPLALKFLKQRQEETAQPSSPEEY